MPCTPPPVVGQPLEALRDGTADLLMDAASDYQTLFVFDGIRLRGTRASWFVQMVIVIHMRSSVTGASIRRQGGAVFLRELLAAAPRVPAQIAHLSGAGGYDDPSIDEALRVFIDAIAKYHRRMAHVYFDISGITGIGQWKEKGELIATRVRQLGLGRVLYGSDGAVSGNTPREHWIRFRQLPLSDAGFRAIEGNVAPYMK